MKNTGREIPKVRETIRKEYAAELAVGGQGCRRAGSGRARDAGRDVARIVLEVARGEESSGVPRGARVASRDGRERRRAKVSHKRTSDARVSSKKTGALSCDGAATRLHATEAKIRFLNCERVEMAQRRA